MVDHSTPRPELARVLERFPGEAQQIRQLFLADRAFRSACDDYRLACEGLATFERLSASAPRCEVEEYRTLVRELEAEIMGMFAKSGGVPGSATPESPVQ